MKRTRRPSDRVDARRQPDLFSAPGPLVLDARTRTAAPRESVKRTPHAPPPIIRPANGLLRVREAAARLGLSKSTLDKMRCEGRGPRFVKITSKIVGYDPVDLDAYAEARKRQSTSEL